MERKIGNIEKMKWEISKMVWDENILFGTWEALFPISNMSKSNKTDEQVN
jgi:hypothetical protein